MPAAFAAQATAHGLADIGQGEGRDEIGASVLQHANLPSMVVLRVVGAHGNAGSVTVAARPDTAADHEWRFARRLCGADLAHHLDAGAVRLGKPIAAIAKLRAPIGIGAPGRALQNESVAVPQRQGNIAIVIGAERRAAALALEQSEGCEHRQLEALMKDERRFEAAIGEKSPPSSCGKRPRYLPC